MYLKQYLAVFVFLCIAFSAFCQKNINDEANIPDEYLVMINSLDSLAVHDNEACIKLLNKLLATPAVPEYEKERLRFMLGASLKNRVGHLATDFTYTLKDGSRGTLRALKSEFVLLFFNDPMCEDCMKVKGDIAISQVINDMLDRGRLKVLSVCVEGDNDEWRMQKLPDSWIDSCDEALRITDREIYDLPTMPVLYLLDRNQKVLLRNATLEKVEKYLNQ